MSERRSPERGNTGWLIGTATCLGMITAAAFVGGAPREASGSTGSEPVISATERPGSPFGGNTAPDNSGLPTPGKPDGLDANGELMPDGVWGKDGQVLTCVVPGAAEHLVYPRELPTLCLKFLAGQQNDKKGTLLNEMLTPGQCFKQGPDSPVWQLVTPEGSASSGGGVPGNAAGEQRVCMVPYNR